MEPIQVCPLVYRIGNLYYKFNDFDVTILFLKVLCRIARYFLLCMLSSIDINIKMCVWFCFMIIHPEELSYNNRCSHYFFVITSRLSVVYIFLFRFYIVFRDILSENELSMKRFIIVWFISNSHLLLEKSWNRSSVSFVCTLYASFTINAVWFRIIGYNVIL